MRFRVPELFLGCFLTVAVFAVGISFSSQYRQATQDQRASKRANEQNHSQKDEGLWDWITHDAAGFFTIWLVVVGGGQLGLFYFQLRLIRESLGPAKEAAIAAKAAAEALPAIERAYVFIIPEIRSLDLVPYISGVGGYYSQVEIHFRIENHGKTPAVIKGVDARLKVLNDAPNNEIHLIVEFVPDKILAGGASYEPHLSPRICEIDDTIAERIEAGHSAIWFFGSIYYDDLFGKEHVTRFRWSHSDILDVFTARGDAPYNERT
jgi:hypothetical protein